MTTIAELRARKKKMSQKKLAEEIGVTQTTISNWEKDVYSMSADNIIKICKYFNVSSDELLGIQKNLNKDMI